MIAIIQHYVRLALLKAKPQEMPASSLLQMLLIFSYFVLALINTSSINKIPYSLLHSLIDLGMLYLFANVLLKDKKERINQTLNAFIGVGLVIGVLHTMSTFVVPVSQDANQISGVAQILFFIIFIWVVVVYGHIIQHATETNMAVSCAIGLIYIILNVMVLVSFSEYLKA